jgi:hypothetical protein
MLDSMIPDVFAKDEELTLGLRRLVQAYRLEVLITHVQVDELIRTPDLRRRGDLLNPLFLIGARSVETAATVLGVEPDGDRPDHKQAFAGSRLGYTRLGDDQINAIVERLMHDRFSDVEDALIIATAFAEHAILVTDERRGRRLPVLVPGLGVWDSAAFRLWALGTHTTPSENAEG